MDGNIMKINITKESKEFLTVAEMPAVKKIVEDFKTSDETIEGIVTTLFHIVTGYNNNNIEIFESTAEMSKNQRVNNFFGDIETDSKDIDIWIKAKFFDKNNDNFYIIGAYLSDIWSASCDNLENSITHMYIRKFKECK